MHYYKKKYYHKYLRDRAISTLPGKLRIGATYFCINILLTGLTFPILRCGSNKVIVLCLSFNNGIQLGISQ